MSERRGAAPDVRLDIRRVTLDGYSPGARDHFTRALAQQLTRRGAPAAVAARAATAILDAVDAKLEAGGGRGHA
jgi:hypothetical protein